MLGSSNEMGVIRKKTITRGGEGGVKYVCDVCSSDITSTVSPILLSVVVVDARTCHAWRAPLKLRLYPTNCASMLSGCHDGYRFALDVPIQHVQTSISVYPASRKARRVMPTTRKHILSALSNRIHSQSLTGNGVPMKNYSCSRVPRYMDSDLGRILQTILEDSATKTRFATIT